MHVHLYFIYSKSRVNMFAILCLCWAVTIYSSLSTAPPFVHGVIIALLIVLRWTTNESSCKKGFIWNNKSIHFNLVKATWRWDLCHFSKHRPSGQKFLLYHRLILQLVLILHFILILPFRWGPSPQLSTTSPHWYLTPGDCNPCDWHKGYKTGKSRKFGRKVYQIPEWEQ